MFLVPQKCLFSLIYISNFLLILFSFGNFSFKVLPIFDEYEVVRGTKYIYM